MVHVGQRRRNLQLGVGSAPSKVSQAEIAYDKKFNKLRRNAETSGMYPLDAPGMPSPLPGGCFVSLAKGLGDKDTSIESKTKQGKKVTEFTPGELLSQLYLEALRKPNFHCKVAVGPNREQLASFVPGHIWGQYLGSANDKDVDGPHPADVMVIGKMPWKEEVRVGRNLWGDAGRLLADILSDLRIRGWGNWYVTNILKFMPPDNSTRVKSQWLKDCLPLLHQELRIVRPKYILCLGTDASKALLGTKYSVTYMDGRVEEYTFPTAFDTSDPKGERLHTAQVVTVVHPTMVSRDPSTKRQLERGLGRFGQLIRGVNPSGEEEGLDHRIIDNGPDLLNTLLEVEHDPEFGKSNVIAVDAEWHGEHPINEGSYLRTIQFSWLPKKAAGVRLTGPGGGTVFAEGIEYCIKLLSVFFRGGTFEGHAFRKKRVVGHFFNADLEWLVHYGLDLRKSFSAPLYDFELTEEHADTPRQKHYASLGFNVGDCVPAWFRSKYEGGADTGLMAHAIEETAMYKLESLAIRYTSCPRYDSALSDWKSSYCREHGLSSKDLEGYGECPDEVLLPYGIYDADVTLRLFFEFDVLLDKDYEGNSCREAFWESQIAAPAVLEIHQSGVRLDMERVESLTTAFLGAREEKVEKLRELIAWEEFNPRSLIHVREFLYGVKLNGKKTEDGKPVRVGPPDALRLNLEPLFDTSKPPRQWAEIKVKGKEDEHTPSTGKQATALLAQDAHDVRYELNSQLTAADYINLLRDWRFLDQVVKTVLRPPEMENDEFIRGDDDELIYKEGLAGHLCDDGRVRTHIYQTKETGRWASARPNLQNISKSRDNDYKRLLGDRYKTKLRSIMCASPGCVLIEADYIGAELFGMAIMSNDSRMIEHAKRNQLGEDHPDFYDIHSNVAKLSFGLECEPTKSAMAAIDKSHLRIVAKSVIFGIAYGRGAKAIAVAAKEQGISITVAESQKIIDTIFYMYPGLRPFFGECQARATREKRIDDKTGNYDGWLVNCFGRYRRFPPINEGDRGLAGEFGRQAMNFPIQSMIASVVSRAMAHLYRARADAGNQDLFKILLQIHDAVLLEVPYEHVRLVAEEILPFVMRECVPIYPTDLEGKATTKEPYYLGIEADMMLHWGEKLSDEKAEELGLPTGTFVEDGMVVNYT